VKPVLIAPLAAADLQEISDYIGRDNPDRARTFVAELQVRARAIAQSPKAYPRRDDLRRGLRMALHKKYLILFQETPDHIEIVRILHGARDLVRLFAKR
jgi:toxin ParE1/3/4